MRRKDREVTELCDILSILDKCKVCRVAMVDDGMPYIVPLNFGYSCDNGVTVLYFHSAFQGRKIDIMRKNPNVCFEADCSHKLTEGETACDFGYLYESVIGEGTIAFIEDDEEKAAALNRIMLHQTGREFKFKADMMKSVAVYKLIVSSLSGKAKREA